MKNITMLLASVAALSLAACSQEPTETDTMADQTAMSDTMPAAPGTIVEVASGNTDFSTLVTAVTAADLGATLSGPGPFTVFAPTDAAFNQLPDGSLADLIKPESKDKLTKILTYHVVSGEVSGEALSKMITDNGGTAELTTVNGAKLTAKIDGGKVVLTDANGGMATVTGADMPTSNGVIHGINAVLMPS